MTKAISATSQKRERDRVICRNTTPVGYRLTSQSIGMAIIRIRG
jgi:hypothetical protein